MHMALRMEDGMEGDALNVQAGCRQRMEQCRLGGQREEKPLTMREGVPEASESFGVSSMTLTLGGKENSSDPIMIAYNQSPHKINQQH